MNRYEEGIKLIEESCGNGKDNVIALSTVVMEPNADGMPSSCVRDVDAYYEDGVFYITTWAKSNKMLQIAQNKETAFAVCFEGIYGHGIGENLGWVLDPKNAELRVKLRLCRLVRSGKRRKRRELCYSGDPHYSCQNHERPRRGAL